jgi:RND family efflux transporter MFP subunit
MRTQQPSLDKAAPEAPGTGEPAPAPTASASKGKAPGRPAHRVLGIGSLAAVVLAGSLVAAALPRLWHAKELATAAGRVADRSLLVRVAIARRAAATCELTLPGNAQAFREVAIYARTNGYVKRWLVDIGDRVTEGQLLAEISAPDVDDQLAQAQANLLAARANLRLSEANFELAKVTLVRDIRSGPGEGSSLLQIDQDRAKVKTTAAQVESARASVRVNEATVQRYADLQSFQKIVAPFASVITARNVDPGALVTADNPSETRELFHLMQTDPLRVFVNVPQAFATSVGPSQPAVVHRWEDPLKRFAGRVTRTAKALDPNTRTLLTQVEVPNPDEVLQPGMYLQVKFVATRITPSVLIPSAALVTRNNKPEVALLDQDNAVRYRKVQLGRDYGAEVEVVTGLEGGETVVVHPGDALTEGQQVEPAAVAKQ